MERTEEQVQEYWRRRAHVRDGYASDSKVRKTAKKAEVRLRKARGFEHINNFGGYQILDSNNNVVAGNDFDLSARDVLEYCMPRIKITPRHSEDAVNR